MALAWLESDKKDLTVNHKDGNKTNNHVDNLEYLTHKENTHHSFQSGIRKIREREVYKLDFNGEILTKYENAKKAAEEMNVKVRTIRDACNGSVGSTCGHLWSYSYNYNPNDPGPSVTRMNKNGVNEAFASVEDAHKKTGVSKKDIYLSCSSGNRLEIWKYTTALKKLRATKIKEEVDSTVDELDIDEWKTHSDFPHYKVSRRGEIFSMKRNKILTPTDERYNSMTICNKDGIPKKIKVHRLVAMIYIPNPDNLPIVNHIDGNQRNNSVENLEWTSQADNIRHSLNNGLTKLHKRKVDKLDNEGNIIQTYDSLKEAGEAHGIEYTNIYRSITKGQYAAGYHWKYAE